MNGSTNYIIRHLQGSENHLLREFLYEAIYIPEGVKPPSKDVVDLPELKLYLEDFGNKKDDFCRVADSEGKVVGGIQTGAPSKTEIAEAYMKLIENRLKLIGE